MSASSFALRLISLITLLALPSPAQAQLDGGLRAGAARIDITPQNPVRMSGYASRKELSTGVHDPLSARVLAFEIGGKRLILVSTDLIGFYDGTAEHLRGALVNELDLEPSQLFLSAIHTHAGPSLSTNLARSHPNNVEYTATLQQKLTEAIGQAIGDLEPAVLGLGVGYSPVGVNRRELRISSDGQSAIVLGRNPYGPTDKEVLVLRVAGTDDRTKAVAFGYATHATCLGPGNTLISGDVLGLAEQLVERVLGSHVIAPAFAGASGDIDPWFRVLPSFNTEPGWIPEPVLLGTLLGQEVVHACRGIKETSPADRIATAFLTLQLPAKPPEAATTGKADTVPFNVTAARLGDVAWIGLGGEVLTEIGLAIKSGSPCRHTFVITHCNGAAGYLATKEAHVQQGYEVRTSPFAPPAADLVIRESIRLLHTL